MFELDVLPRPHCGSRLRHIAVLEALAQLWRG